MILTRFARRLIFKPDPVQAAPAVMDGARFEVAQVTTHDGLHLRGLVSDPTLPARATLLFLHGNGGCAANRTPFVAPLAHLGFQVIAADYRGYGGNPGTPSRSGLHLDATAWLDYALAHARGSLIVLGHSLGGALAIEMLADRPHGVAGLLTLGSIAALEFIVPAPVARMTDDNFDARSAAGRLRLPWFIVHQGNDEVVPIRHSQALFERARANPDIHFVELAGGGHALQWDLLTPMLEQLRERGSHPDEVIYPIRNERQDTTASTSN